MCAVNCRLISDILVVEIHCLLQHIRLAFTDHYKVAVKTSFMITDMHTNVSSLVTKAVF